jgi:hypothetical protein
MRAAPDVPVVSVLAVGDRALEDASASCGGADFMAKTRFGRHAFASGSARFARTPGPDRDR